MNLRYGDTCYVEEKHPQSKGLQRGMQQEFKEKSHPK